MKLWAILPPTILRSLAVGLAITTCVVMTEPVSAKADIRNHRVPNTNLTVRKAVEAFFASNVLPKGGSYKGVSIHLDEVKAERVQTDFRGGFWVTVKARYAGSAWGISIAENIRLHFDAGHVKVDVGALKGVFNTKGITNAMGNLKGYLSQQLISSTDSQQSVPGKTSSEFQRYFEQQVASGMIPTDLMIWSSGTSLRYDAKFRPNRGTRFAVRHGLNNQQMREQDEHWTQRGFRLAKSQSAVANGQRYHIAIWVR